MLHYPLVRDTDEVKYILEATKVFRNMSANLLLYIK